MAAVVRKQSSDEVGLCVGRYRSVVLAGNMSGCFLRTSENSCRQLNVISYYPSRALFSKQGSARNRGMNE